MIELSKEQMDLVSGGFGDGGEEPEPPPPGATPQAVAIYEGLKTVYEAAKAIADYILARQDAEIAAAEAKRQAEYEADVAAANARREEAARQAELDAASDAAAAAARERAKSTSDGGGKDSAPGDGGSDPYYDEYADYIP